MATPGQLVELAAGTYSDTAISTDSSKTSATDVIFRPVAGATVTFTYTQTTQGHNVVSTTVIRPATDTTPITDPTS